jgi:helix-turn-helix protein
MGYYSYSMPEGFLEDQSVPARWRILGVVNGFHINGKDCYASNEWFMQKLGCSEQTVSNGIKELEERNEVLCVRTRRSRLIKRVTRDPSQLGSQPEPVRVSDPSSFGTNSISNSINRTIGAAAQKYDSPEEEKPKRESGAKYPNALKIFELFGKYPQNWKRNTTFLLAAEEFYNDPDLGLEEAEYILKDWYPKNKDREFCPQIFNPQDLLNKHAKLEAYAKKS